MDGRFLNVGPGIVPYSSLYKKPTTAFLIFWISAAGRSSKNSAGSPVTFVATIFAYVVVLSGTKLLYYFGQKAQKKQAAQQEQLEATRQVVSMLIIDKKRLKLKLPM